MSEKKDGLTNAHDEFKKRVGEINKRISQHETEKQKAVRMKELAGKTAGRDDAERNGKDPQQVIFGHQEEERKADRAIQIEKDSKFNSFSTERERIKAERHAAWLKAYADMIEPLNSQIADALSSEKTELGFIDNVLSDHSEAHKEMARVDTQIDSFNQFGKDNKIAGNLFIPVAEKLLPQYENEVRKTLNLTLRRFEATIKKISAAFDAPVAARAKKL
jgi:hypothetical protein